MADQLSPMLGEPGKSRVAGVRFGMLTVLGEMPTRGKWGERIIAVRCDCGNESTAARGNLIAGRTQSCGCQVGNRTHGMSRQPIYRAWQSMRYRCNRPGLPNYRNYGGRGICVCARWDDSFEAFYEDMGPSWQQGLTLDRIDNNGNYDPGNCCWATPAVQMRNTRKNVFVDTPWGRLCLVDAAKRVGISMSAFAYRRRNGLPMFETRNLHIILIDTPWGRMTLAEAARCAGVPRETFRHRHHTGKPLFGMATGNRSSQT